MADGFHLEVDLDKDTGERLKAAAEAAGMAPSDYAASLLQSTVFETDWSLAEARLAEFDRTGVSHDGDTVLREFQRNVAEGVARRR